jgi:hypothetical protein
MQYFLASASNFLPKSSPPKTIKTLDVAAIKLGTNAQLSSSAVYCQRSTSTALPFSFPDSLPCLQLTFSRRTSRYCPKTFQVIVFCFSPSPWHTECPSLYICLPPFSPFVLSHFFVFSCRLTRWSLQASAQWQNISSPCKPLVSRSARRNTVDKKRIQWMRWNYNCACCLFMGVKLGRSHWGRNVGWGFLRIGGWGV